MTDKEKLTTLVRDFVSRVHCSEPVHESFSLEELRTPSRAWSNPQSWGTWSNQPGVYYFVFNGSVQFVGRALIALGGRIQPRINNVEPKWERVLKDPSTAVGLLMFDRQGWYWPASLEVLLIDTLKPPLNEKLA